MIREDSALHGDQQKILVVEDDEDVRRITVRLLKGLNYEVIEANDGPGALRKLAELDEGGGGVDLVFSDVVMPFGMNGIDLSIAIWGKYPNTPVVLTSGYPEKVLRDAGLGEEDLRQIKVIRKPYTRQILSESMAEVLNPAA
jgi:CheY-like chemotaxis protein